MHKSSAIILLFILIFTRASYSCTAFLLKSADSWLVGNNYDWISKEGCLLINQRNISKTAIGMDSLKAASWISKYGSITFNQYGKEFPQGGMNEKGFVVITLVLSETIYPQYRNGETCIDEAQWIQYQLDNFSSVKEAMENINHIGIIPHAMNLHYFLADRSGGCAVVEFLNGKTVISEGANFRYKTITNSTYQYSEEYFEKAYQYQPKMPRSSLNRFSRAAELVTQFDSTMPAEKGKDYCFYTLGEVPIKGWTVWSIVYDTENMRIYWKPKGKSKIKYIDFSSFTFDADKPVLYFDINSKKDGDVGKLFSPYSFEKNREIVIKTYKDLDVRFSGSDFELFCRYQIEPWKYHKTDMFSNTCNLTISIKGVDNGYGPTFTGLMNSKKGYRKLKPFRGAEMPAYNNTATWVVYNIPKGKYTVACFHDINGNDKTDMILGFLPNEPVAFSNNARGVFIKPSFKKAVFTINENENLIIVDLKKQ